MSKAGMRGRRGGPVGLQGPLPRRLVGAGTRPRWKDAEERGARG